MNHYIHIANDKGRDATVGFSPVKSPAIAHLGVPEQEISFHKYLIAGENRQHEDLAKALSREDYGDALVKSDPELDIEVVGMRIDHTVTVFLDSAGEVMRADPRFIDLLLDPNGVEKERKDPADSTANVNEELPLRWSGKKIPLQDALRKFYFKRTIQLCHTDGLTFDFLFNIAKQLEDEKVLMLLGGGTKGTDPLILQANGRAYRGFLSGRTDGKRYKLMLHLSDMELKKPVAKGD